MLEYQRILAVITSGLKARTKGRFEINENTDLANQLNLDSIQAMELLLDVEDQLDVSIPVSVLSNVKTVKELVLAILNITRGEE